MSMEELMTKRIAVIPGDGIGKEVVPVGVACVTAALERHGVRFGWEDFDWSSDYYLEHGRMMPENALEILAGFDAVYLGAVGMPGVSDVESLWGLLIPIRRRFNQYINLRPVKVLPGVAPPVPAAAGMDLMIVRENSEGEYSDVGAHIGAGTAEEYVTQETKFSRKGIERVAEYAFELAATRGRRVTSATKSNGIIHTMPFWDSIVEEVAGRYEDRVSLEPMLIDALAAKLVLQPGTFDVIVGSNLFGDILSDLAGAIAGSIGAAPSANLNPEGAFPSMFEPVHGSAPDIAGTGIANPIGQIWSGAMMLDHLGYPEAAADLKAAFESALGQGIRTADLGGVATTEEMGAAVLANLEHAHG
jgi:tartrate dehydrogenase/decarboxylase/D-malate dehydrogenase